MKILVIFTGGTIGCAEKDGWLSTDEETKYVLINKYRKETGDNETDFVTTSPYWILSENLSSAELNTLIKCVGENLKKDFDGIIVTHGTDTLQYSASALAFAFGDCEIPVVFVSAAYPLEDGRTNGHINFIAAVSFVKSGAGKGVYISYKNEGDTYVNIHTATRVMSHGEASGDLYSIDNQPFAFCEKDKIVLNEDYKESKTDTGVGEAVLCKSPEILTIHCCPGDGYGYSLEKCRAVIIVPYHSGTLNTENNDFFSFCKRAKDKNIPLFVVNSRAGMSYESKKAFDDLGLEILPLCTRISVYMKCWFAMSLGVDIRDFVQKPAAQEYVEV